MTYCELQAQAQNIGLGIGQKNGTLVLFELSTGTEPVGGSLAYNIEVSRLRAALKLIEGRCSS